MAKTVMAADAEAASLNMLFNSEDKTIERLADSVRATITAGLAAAKAAREGAVAPLYAAYRAAADAANYPYSEPEMVAYRAYLSALGRYDAAIAASR